MKLLSVNDIKNAVSDLTNFQMVLKPNYKLNLLGFSDDLVNFIGLLIDY